MKNLMKKKLLSSAISVALVAGVGFSGGAQAIHLAEDGIGQMLMAPFYLANAGFESEMVVVNTNPNTAVKAKVVIRSQVVSEELLDFVCYLTPGDVCRFELIRACGSIADPIKAPRLPVATMPLTLNCPESEQYTFMRSQDDSIKSPVAANEVPSNLIVDSLENSTATWASVKPVIRGLLVPSGRTDRQDLGHIEVIGVYGVQNGSDLLAEANIPVEGRNSRNESVFVHIRQGMSKFSLAQIFDTPRTASSNVLAYRQPATPLEPDVVTANNRPFEREERNQFLEQRVTNTYVDNAPLGTLYRSRIRSTDPEWVRLMGTVELKQTDATGRITDRMSYRIPALAGSIGDAAIRGPSDAIPYAQARDIGILGSSAQFDGLVISNPVYDASVARASVVGAEFGVLDFGEGGQFGYSKVVEIESALAATDLQGTYRDDTNLHVQRQHSPGANVTHLVVTFPTRYVHFNVDWCSSGLSGPYTPPFQTVGTAHYRLKAYDDFENDHSVVGVPFSPSDLPPGVLVEVNYFLPTWPKTELNSEGAVLGLDFRKGWFDMTFVDVRPGCPYAGMPVLALSHQFTNYGDGVSNSQLLPVSHQPIRECGEVTRVSPGVVNPSTAINSLCLTQRQDYPASQTGAAYSDGTMIEHSNPNVPSYTFQHHNQ